jgi:hypothetical protein
MSVNVEQIKPETLAIIERQAKLFGLSVDDYLRSLLPKTERELPLARVIYKDFEEDMAVFAEDGTFSGYRGTYSREDIYFDHD